MPQTTLALIVKNEAPTIALTLASARAALGPGPTVVHDTGSDDGTVDAIHAWATARPYEQKGTVYIYHRRFDDFASARNACLEDAWKHGDGAHVCMVDAGVIVKGTAIRHTYVPGKASAYSAVIRLGALSYERPQIFPPGWRYVGKVHEYADGPRADRVTPSGLTFSYELKDVERGRRWVRDLALLEDDFTARGRFYYAQTLDCLGRRSQAIAAYRERWAIVDEGFWQERAVAMLRCIKLAKDAHEAEAFANAALEVDPSRGEAYLELIPFAQERQYHGLAYELATKAIATVPRAGALFVDMDREWKANVAAGDAASSRGDFKTACWHWKRALELEGGRMPVDDRSELELGLRLNGGAS
jgi:hypothetical protein